jgi:outer membrane protein assembly factor BamB
MKSNPRYPLVLALAVITGARPAAGAEWSHIAGPAHDRKTTESVPTTWPSGGPRKVWEISANGGFSSFVTGDGLAYTVVSARGTGSRETVIAVDRKTGKTLWETPLGTARYAQGGDRGVRGNDGGDGPRATPVFADDRLFVFGANFDLYALEAATGKIIWKRDLIREFGGSALHWQNAASPLVMGDRVLVAGGGRNQAYLAFRTDNGEVLWKAGTDRATYSTPILATIHGKAQAIFMAERGIVSRDPVDGRELWHYPFPYRTATAASPVVWNDIVHCTAGYGVGGAACRVTRKGDTWDVTELWRSPGNRDTAAHWSTAVVHDGFLYGCYGHGEYGSGSFKCIDIRTGKVRWQKPGFGHGQVIMAGNRLLATSDAGRLVLIEPTPTAYREIAKANVIDGKVWASPALSDGQILVRSTKKGICLQL